MCWVFASFTRYKQRQIVSRTVSLSFLNDKCIWSVASLRHVFFMYLFFYFSFVLHKFWNRTDTTISNMQNLFFFSFFHSYIFLWTLRHQIEGQIVFVPHNNIDLRISFKCNHRQCMNYNIDTLMDLQGYKCWKENIFYFCLIGIWGKKIKLFMLAIL